MFDHLADYIVRDRFHIQVYRQNTPINKVTETRQTQHKGYTKDCICGVTNQNILYNTGITIHGYFRKVLINKILDEITSHFVTMSLLFDFYKGKRDVDFLEKDVRTMGLTLTVSNELAEQGLVNMSNSISLKDSKNI